MLQELCFVIDVHVLEIAFDYVNPAGFFSSTSFSLCKGIQQLLSLLLFLYQVLEGGQAMTIFSSLLYNSTLYTCLFM